LLFLGVHGLYFLGFRVVIFLEVVRAFRDIRIIWVVRDIAGITAVKVIM
jgi:hypothetical protein